VIGEKPQMAGGAPALAVQARLWQAGFGGSDFGDRLGARLDLLGDGFQQARALLA
jgi:hypothetical protein